jgi:hypothetical protein
MNCPLWCVPLVTMRKGIAIVAILYSAKPCKGIIGYRVDIASHALPKLVTAWHLGHDQV